MGIESAFAVAVGGSSRLCFPIQCPAPSLPETGGAVIEAGTCAADGSIGDRCRLGCKIGYDESNVVEGRCEARWLEREEVAVAEYVGQEVTCLPARNPDGSMAESYCRMERAEAILDCCDQEAQQVGDTQCVTCENSGETEEGWVKRSYHLSTISFPSQYHPIALPVQSNHGPITIS